MTLTVVNETTYKNLRIAIDNKVYQIKKGENLINDVPSNFKMSVSISDKNSVGVYWFFVLIDGFIVEDSIVARVNCNSQYDITLQGESNTIVLDDIKAYPENDCCCEYHSVILKTNDAIINSAIHTLTDFKKVKKKFIACELLIAGLLPVVFALLVLFAVMQEPVFLVLALLFLLFSQFAFRKVAKVNFYFNDETANQYLNEAIIREINREIEKKDKPGLFRRILEKILK